MRNPKLIEDDVIDIPLHVPVNGVLDTLTVRSDISWGAFHSKIAKAMETSLENLSIAYKFSTNAKADPPHKLDSAHNLFQLLEDVSEELSGAAGKLQKKKFMVDIVDIWWNKTKAQSNKKEKADDEDSNGGGKPADAVNWDNDTDVAKLPSLKIVIGLQMKYACTQHQGYCFILKNGDHRKIPLSDISHWAFMINKFPKKYSLQTPPSVLKIKDYDAWEKEVHSIATITMTALTQLDDYNHFLMAISKGDIPCIQQIINVALHSGTSI
ncbi:hypothetical protein DFH29DRAFT_1002836 [Suillus ampliporus]|nr:hypothetical protein DFH29DRAFT_1002836 [Suillus ampliporus]